MKKLRVDIGFQFIFSFLLVIVSVIFGFVLVDWLNPGKWYNTVISVAIAITVGLIIGILFSKSIDRYIETLRDFISSISKGDLTHESSLKRVFDDELNQIFQAILEMKENLKEMVKDIQEIAIKTDEFSNTILASAENISITAEEIHNSAENLTRKAERQLDIFEDVSKSLNNLKEKLQKDAKNTLGTLKLSDEMEKKSKRTLTNIEGTLGDLRKILSEVEDSGKSVLSLLESVKESEELIEIIEEVTRKTDLLAINAAIEATKAGEYGSSFSVIAEEIRHLADNTKKSTERIKDVMESIKEKSSVVRGKMEEVSSGVKKGEGNLDAVYDEVEDVSRDIDSFTKFMKEMGASIIEENKIIENVTGEVDKAADISRETTMGLSEITKAIEFESEHIAKIYSEIKELNKEIEHLKALTLRFKI